MIHLGIPFFNVEEGGSLVPLHGIIKLEVFGGNPDGRRVLVWHVVRQPEVISGVKVANAPKGFFLCCVMNQLKKKTLDGFAKFEPLAAKPRSALEYGAPYCRGHPSVVNFCGS